MRGDGDAMRANGDAVRGDGFLDDWTFDVQEISSNVYEVIGTDKSGHRVQTRGTNLDHLIADARRAAQSMTEGARARRA